MPTYSELKRTHTCGELRPEHIGKTVKLNGWVDGYRNLGGLLFLDLRDRYGITQVMINPETFSRDMLAEAEKARHEFVVAVIGTVAQRPSGTENAKLDTGAIEVQVSQFYILSTSKTPPFEISEHTTANEQLRLEYRYLDLRRKPLQERIKFRSQTAMAVRNHLVKEGFLEIETPLLIRSTPEGARDYVVPSRIYHGKFYALPQSPQLLKQILMVSGYDKYFQLARCLRDEDLRADRQPEHTQIDMEMSYVTPDDIFGVVERMLKAVFKEMLNVDIKTPFPRYDYDEVMNKYGSDKPDARFGMELIDLSAVVRGSGFKVFAENVEKGGVVKGIVLSGGAAYSRKQIDDLTEFAKTKGASGLAYILRSDAEIKSPIAKFLSEAELNKIMETAKLNVGDALFIVSGRPTYTEETLGQLRMHLARTHNLIPTNEWSLFFVTHFPLFYYNEEFKRFEAMHNIVSHPREVDMPLLDEGFNTSTPAADINHPWRRMKASQYDLVINGWEIASGGQRINRRDLQEKVLDILGIDNQRADRMFGFLLKALEYGAPPHAGIALGLDRLIAIMTGSDSIRDVMAFPKTAAAVSLMDGCPTTIEQDQLDELGLIIKGGQTG